VLRVLRVLGSGVLGQVPGLAAGVGVLVERGEALPDVEMELVARPTAKKGSGHRRIFGGAARAE
jgi:hypothetical protein